MYTFTLPNKSIHTAEPSALIEAIRWNQRKIPKSHGCHVTGYHSPGAGRPLVPFESATEARAIAFLLKQPGVHFILSQPFTIRYRWHGRLLHYTPDLLVASQPVAAALRRQGFGPLSVIEIKGVVVSDAIVDSRLRVITSATGLPALLGVPVLNYCIPGAEVGHAL